MNARAWAFPAALLLSLNLLVTPSAAAERPLDLDLPAVAEFVARMEQEHGIPASETRAVLGSAAVQPKIIEAMRRPAEKVKPWHEYRQIFITDKRIDAGIAFWREQAETLDQVYEATGVPPEIVVGILGVETFYGRITGGYRVVDALATLAFEYPPRSKFFTSELEQFLLLTREQEIDPLVATGSYAGAMGGPQFISSSYRAYAVDGSGDGRVDLWDSWPDIISSVANYFAAHGWLRDAGLEFGPGAAAEPAMLFELAGADGPEFWVGFKNFYVITRYNRSNMYAMAVYELGQAISNRRAEASGDT